MELIQTHLNTVFFQVLSPANTISSTSSISSTASHFLRSSKLSHLTCYAVLYIYIYVCVSLPSSMHFARVDVLFLVDVAAG